MTHTADQHGGGDGRRSAGPGVALSGRAVDGGGSPTESLLVVENLTKHFPIKKGFLSRTVGVVKAVDGISFEIKQGETLGLVGESGCGKTTTGRLILRLLEATAGKVLFRGENVFDMDGEELRRLRRQMQIVFQDPYGSLNPRITVGGMLTEALKVHGIADGRAAQERVAELLEVVGLSARHATRYPHEFSGGQRQRIGIARALSVNPKFVVADEPVSALDVSVQAQVINLMQDLQQNFGLTYLFIAHDLSVVEHISDRVAVMYQGRIVELADSEELYRNPLHPYTRTLLAAVPIPDPKLRNRPRRLAVAEPADAAAAPAHSAAGDGVPELRDVGGGHWVAATTI